MRRGSVMRPLRSGFLRPPRPPGRRRPAFRSRPRATPGRRRRPRPYFIGRRAARGSPAARTSRSPTRSRRSLVQPLTCSFRIISVLVVVHYVPHTFRIKISSCCTFCVHSLYFNAKRLPVQTAKMMRNSVRPSLRQRAFLRFLDMQGLEQECEGLSSLN